MILRIPSGSFSEAKQILNGFSESSFCKENPINDLWILYRDKENPCTCPPEFPVCVCGKKPLGKATPKKPILPSEEELEYNSRSKSAKLRVFEKA